MKYKNIAEIEAELTKYIPAVMDIIGKDITLSRMKPLMKLLGNPEDKLRIIHVAGTSGKTSTVYYISSLLKEAGQKVGSTVSPHVDSVAERIQINLQPIDEQDFCQAFTDFMNIVRGPTSHIEEPTYFEVLMAFAIWHFASQKVDYVVLETGLGGLHDASNVAERADKICVITDIGLDHTRILGKTVKEITAQKAGIIHGGNTVFAYDQPQEITSQIRRACDKKHAIAHFLSQQAISSDLPVFQKRNWYLAKQVYDFVAKRDGLDPLSEQQVKNSQSIVIPARMETIKKGGKTIILDGSHNGQKIGALVEAVSEKYDEPVACLVSFVKSEENRVIDGLMQLKKLKPYLITTRFTATQDTPKESVDPAIIQKQAEAIGLSSEIVGNPQSAFKKLIKRPEKILLVTGSFYLLNHIRPLIINKHD